jgi:putative DNA primase/helicase
MAPEDERRPPRQEEAPHGELENPTRKSLARGSAGLNDSTRASHRPPTYVPPSADSIPPELKGIDHWVAWRYELRPDRNGKLKLTKVPVDPLTGTNAKTNDKTTWGTFEQAWARYERDGLDGVGLVLTLEVGIIGIDVDHCRIPESGIIDDEALAIVREIDSYTEISPSGTGVRIFARGKLPPKGRKKGRVEIYDSGRFLTVTGAHVEVLT